MGLFDKLRKANPTQKSVQKPLMDIPGFTRKDSRYEAVIDGINVVFWDSDMNTGNAAFAPQVAAAYNGKLPEIVKHILADDGFPVFFPNAKADDVPAALGQPTIRVIDGDSGIISYTNQTLDDIHIIDVEFSGAIDELSYVSIDG